MSPKTNYYTPFELQVVVNSVSAQGITILISTTSATQVHSLFISYIIYDPTILNAVGTEWAYDKYIGIASYSHKYSTDFTSVTAHLVGISGFIASNPGSSPFYLTIGYDAASNSATAKSSANFYYLVVSGFYLLGGSCGQCKGYSIPYNGNCVAACPPSSYFNGVTCVVCNSGQVWNGTNCVTPAPVVPATPSTPANVISCPAGTYWDAMQLRCLPCKSGCANCVDCDSCIKCSPGFFQPSQNALC